MNKENKILCLEETAKYPLNPSSDQKIQVGISIDDIWVGCIIDICMDNENDVLTIPLKIQDQKIEIIADSGAGYNLMDYMR